MTAHQARDGKGRFSEMPRSDAGISLSPGPAPDDFVNAVGEYLETEIPDLRDTGVFNGPGMSYRSNDSNDEITAFQEPQGYLRLRARRRG